MEKKLHEILKYFFVCSDIELLWVNNHSKRKTSPGNEALVPLKKQRKKKTKESIIIVHNDRLKNLGHVKTFIDCGWHKIQEPVRV